MSAKKRVLSSDNDPQLAAILARAGTAIGKRSKKAKRTRSVPKNLQVGSVIPEVPVANLGAAVGTHLGSERKAGMRVHYEKADCPCNGTNERCVKCDGTGYYTKEVVDQFFGASGVAAVERQSRPRASSKAESTFSNDHRGDEYGIRERGRYSSNPLHDDHE